jgi:hypothetical protein
MSRYVDAIIILGAAVAFVATLFFAHDHGRRSVLHAWDKERAEYAERVRAVEAAHRETEQQLLLAKEESEKRYAELRKRNAVDSASARTELDRLRNALAAPRSGAAAPDSSAGPRVAAGARLEQELLGQCAATLVGLAAEADRLESIVVGLQTYVKSVCLRP